MKNAKALNLKNMKETIVNYSGIKRVRKCGELRAVLCVETRNKCFGRPVYEDLESGDLAVIINVPSGEVFVDLDTFLESHRFFEKVEVRE